MQVYGQTSYSFHHLKTDDGLSNSNVKAVLKDSYGFLWVGTQAGLNRYDGYGFKTYNVRPEQSKSFWSQDIWGICEDGLGNIWINSSYNYFVYNREKDNFIYDIPDFLSNLDIQLDNQYYKIYIDKKRNIWILNSKTIQLYDTRLKKLNSFNINIVLENEKDIELTDDGEDLYLVQRSADIWQFNKNTGKFVPIELPENIQHEISGSKNRIYVDYRKGLWLFSEKSEILYHRSDLEHNWEKLFLNSAVDTHGTLIRAILDDKNGHVWIGTDHKGVFVYDTAKKNLTNCINDPWLKNSIASNNVEHIYCDDNGIIWLGHNKQGLSYYHENFHKFTNVQYQDCQDISAILEDKHGNIWLGTDGNGLFIKENNTEKVRKLPIPNNPIVSLIEDLKGRIWIGTYQNGLFCYDNGKIRQFTLLNSALGGHSAWNLSEDRFGNMWIGSSMETLQCFNPNNETFVSVQTPNGSNIYPMIIHYDKGDKLYVGTSNGLYVIDIITSKQKHCLGNNKGTQSFEQVFISAIYKDKKDILWLAHSQGLTAWDLKTDSLYYMDKDSGLCDNIVQAIIEDSHQNIYVTTSYGLSIISVERMSEGELSFSIRNFSVNDGLKNNYFNKYAICKLHNGNILLGSTDCYTLVNPNKMLEKNQPLAKVTFTGLTVGNHPIQVNQPFNGRKLLDHPMEQTSTLKFEYSDKLISIEFTTGDLLNANKVKYAYLLEGLNSQWYYTSENKVVFTTLHPGSYRLLVKACNSDGVWNDEVTELDILVTPPFYLSKLAFLLYALLIIFLLVFAIYRTHKHNHKKIQQQLIQLEHEQKIRLNEMKLKFFTNISHDLRTPLTLIITPLQIMINEFANGNLHKRLQTMYKNAQQLMELIDTLLDFRKLDVGAETLRCKTGDIVRYIKEVCDSFQDYAIDRYIDISFSSEIESVSMAFDPDKIRKIINNLLSNAFKYTPDKGAIKIHVYKQEDKLNISISDTGKGIDNTEKKAIFERFYQTPHQQEKTGSGIGLHIVNEYVHLHGGEVFVSDNIPQGSVFTFTLPIIELGESTEFIYEDEPSEACIDGLNECKPAASPVLLLVDDNRDFCEFMADSLSDDYIVLTAENGQEALEVLKNTDINIVVSDVMMPVMDGTELCRQMKTNIHWSHIPIILLTARTAEESRIESLESGADDYITKPFNFNVLKLRINKFIEWTEKCHHDFSQKVDISPSEITITSLDEQLIQKAIQVVEEHLTDTNFSVEILSETLGLSRSHLYKKLMCITGKGPAEFIRIVRLKRGRQLLDKSQMQIAEIAYAVGFNSPKRFTQNFRNEFGISPSDYLRSLK